MHLAAYYISSNEFGIENQTINFGGKYFYKLEESKSAKLKVTRILNEKYIPKFYDETEKLTQVSAIVGRNGTGKTTLLKSLIYEINLYQERSGNILIFEKADNIILIRSDYQIKKDNEIIEVSDDIKVINSDLKINTIYYSPHLDNKGALGDIDLSVDSFLYNDLAEVEYLSYFTNTPNPITQHKLNNFRRQMGLYFSDEISKVLHVSFNLPRPDRIKVSFIKIDKSFRDSDSWKGQFDFHNTPYEVRHIFEEILKKSRLENKLLKRNGIQTQKKLMKEYLLLGLMSTMVNVMEKQNTFLDEGRLESNWKEMIINLDSVDTFYYFLDTHHYVLAKTNKSKKIPDSISPIPSAETKSLLSKLYSVIDGLEAKNEYDTRYFDWNDKCIYPKKEDVDELYRLDVLYLDRMRSYFQAAYKSKESLIEVISFINFEWYDRTPSSGENSIFNLFSRLLTIKSEIKNSDRNYYLLLLDEGDSGFHPEWKKKYVEIITKVTPLLFDKEEINFQLIFTTHDPFTLSDILNYNIVYINKKDNSGSHKLISEGDINRPQKSFAANITDLLSDSFFIDDGLIGDFSKRKIKETINWLNNTKQKSDADNYFEKLIKNIDEPIVQRKLGEMYDEKMKTNTLSILIDEQIKKLQEQKSNLKAH